MRRHFGQVGRFALAAAVAGALGFGATQAVAAPSASAASVCSDHDICDNYCTSQGYLAGKCINWACNCLNSNLQWVRVPF
ncbi:MAG TPA: hypothetical protein VFQ39_07275 [Longimicrobium sp.]|nr:hypothetical protein [Longimicrobium sp.]